MKKNYPTLFALILLCSMLTYCSKKDQPVSTPEPETKLKPAEITPISYPALLTETLQATISGKVLDQHQQPVPGASVQSGSTAVTTNNNGEFSFPKSALKKMPVMSA